MTSGMIIADKEYEVIHEATTRIRKLPDGTKLRTEASSYDGICELEYEAGTTGEKGGDWGHGSRVYLRLENAVSVGWEIKATEDKLEIILGGDAEICAVKCALRFMLDVLERQTQKDS
jgi:hypothetical protein